MEIVKLITDLFKYNTGYLVKHLNHIDKTKLYIKPDSKANPAIWIFGHIVVSRGSLIELLGGDPSTRNYNPYFLSGTKPENDPSEYPPFDKMLSLFGKLGTMLDCLINKGGGALLDRQVWGNYDTIGKHVVSGYIHESYHIGQLSYLLNLLNKPSYAKARIKFARKKQDSTGKVLLNSLKSVLTVK